MCVKKVSIEELKKNRFRAIDSLFRDLDIDFNSILDEGVIKTEREGGFIKIWKTRKYFICA